MPYYQRKLEMVSGRMLSGDHSHKIAKVILIERKHGFQGLYTVMNEFGKVVSFWLVNSTNMKEVEERLRDIERRYRLHGFQGPFQFTVDTCCMTQQFLAGMTNNKKEPVFLTLVRSSASASDADAPQSEEHRWVKMLHQRILHQRKWTYSSLHQSKLCKSTLHRRCHICHKP